jgi:hypothetical protein
VSTHTYFRKLMRDMNIIDNLTITVYSADNSGNYVEEITKNFSHFEATWSKGEGVSVHAKEGMEYYRCATLDDAYKVVVNNIQKHFGAGYTVEG